MLDFVRYAERHGIDYDPLSSYAISLAQLQDIAKEQGVIFRQGDVLLVRSGLSKWIRVSTPEDKGPFEKSGCHMGVDPTRELLEWLWNQNFGAVGGDAIAFESVPASDGSCKQISLAFGRR